MGLSPNQAIFSTFQYSLHYFSLKTIYQSPLYTLSCIVLLSLEVHCILCFVQYFYLPRSIAYSVFFCILFEHKHQMYVTKLSTTSSCLNGSLAPPFTVNNLSKVYQIIALVSGLGLQEIAFCLSRIYSSPLYSCPLQQQKHTL